MTPEIEVKQKIAEHQKLTQFLNSAVNSEPTVPAETKNTPWDWPYNLNLLRIIFEYLGDIYFIQQRQLLEDRERELKNRDTARKNKIQSHITSLQALADLPVEILTALQKIPTLPFSNLTIELQELQKRTRFLDECESVIHRTIQQNAANHLLYLYHFLLSHSQKLRGLLSPENAAFLDSFLNNPVEFFSNNPSAPTLQKGLRHLFFTFFNLLLENRNRLGLSQEEESDLYKIASDFNLAKNIFYFHLQQREYSSANRVLEIDLDTDRNYLSEVVTRYDLLYLCKSTENWKNLQPLFATIKKQMPSLFLDIKLTLHVLLTSGQFEPAIFFIEAGTPLPSDIQQICINWFTKNPFGKTPPPLFSLIETLLNSPSFKEHIKEKGFDLIFLKSILGDKDANEKLMKSLETFLSKLETNIFRDEKDSDPKHPSSSVVLAAAVKCQLNIVYQLLRLKAGLISDPIHLPRRDHRHRFNTLLDLAHEKGHKELFISIVAHPHCPSRWNVDILSTLCQIGDKEFFAHFISAYLNCASKFDMKEWVKEVVIPVIRQQYKCDFLFPLIDLIHSRDPSLFKETDLFTIALDHADINLLTFCINSKIPCPQLHMTGTQIVTTPLHYAVAAISYRTNTTYKDACQIIRLLLTLPDAPKWLAMLDSNKNTVIHNAVAELDDSSIYREYHMLPCLLDACREYKGWDIDAMNGKNQTVAMMLLKSLDRDTTNIKLTTLNQLLNLGAGKKVSLLNSILEQSSQKQFAAFLCTPKGREFTKPQCNQLLETLCRYHYEFNEKMVSVLLSFGLFEESKSTQLKSSRSSYENIFKNYEIAKKMLKEMRFSLIESLSPGLGNATPAQRKAYNILDNINIEDVDFRLGTFSDVTNNEVLTGRINYGKPISDVTFCNWIGTTISEILRINWRHIPEDMYKYLATLLYIQEEIFCKPELQAREAKINGAQATQVAVAAIAQGVGIATPATPQTNTPNNADPILQELNSSITRAPS